MLTNLLDADIDTVRLLMSDSWLLKDDGIWTADVVRTSVVSGIIGDNEG